MHEHRSVTRLVIYGVLLLLSFDIVHRGIERQLPEEVATSSTVAEVAGIDPLNEDAYYDAEEEYMLVTKVIDGDTIRVHVEGVEETVRLIGIDTPETVDPRKPVQCFGREASAQTHKLLDGQSVRLETDASQDARDKYGRLLAYVYLPDGTFVNQQLIVDGFAYEYTYRVPYRLQAKFREAERVARTEGRGLWADGACGLKNISSHEATPHGTSTSALGVYVCHKNTYNCSDFTTQAEAQSAFIQCGGPATDIHHLDVDKDGVVCESLK